VTTTTTTDRPQTNRARATSQALRHSTSHAAGSAETPQTVIKFEMLQLAEQDATTKSKPSKCVPGRDFPRENG